MERRGGKITWRQQISASSGASGSHVGMGRLRRTRIESALWREESKRGAYEIKRGTQRARDKGGQEVLRADGRDSNTSLGWTFGHVCMNF